MAAAAPQLPAEEKQLIDSLSLAEVESSLWSSRKELRELFERKQAIAGSLKTLPTTGSRMVMSGDMFVELSTAKLRELVALDAENIQVAVGQLQVRIKLLESALRTHAATSGGS
eukprot:TRINITY_DN12307_c0_g3_i1.p1 TRINITY_DN12307_c0_g3~~TRINITY_DN12307_c0_g3_i1.p1  ORF type:complete len:114 (-),score=44.62 TRINITY_DN12307_c0_g3_i1:9-350(-)